MKTVIGWFTAIIVLIATIIFQLIPLALLIFLIVQTYLHNIEYHQAILIAIAVKSVLSIFSSIATNNKIMKLLDTRSEKILFGTITLVDILQILAVASSAVFFYLGNNTYAYYLIILQFIIMVVFSFFGMLYKDMRAASIISLIFNIIYIIVFIILMKHAEIMLVVYYIFNYIMFLKTFYLGR